MSRFQCVAASLEVYVAREAPVQRRCLHQRPDARQQCWFAHAWRLVEELNVAHVGMIRPSTARMVVVLRSFDPKNAGDTCDGHFEIDVVDCEHVNEAVGQLTRANRRGARPARTDSKHRRREICDSHGRVDKA